MQSNYETIVDPAPEPDVGQSKYSSTQSAPVIPEYAFYTRKRIRVMRQIFVVTLALFTGLFVMYMTYYYFVRVEINKTNSAISSAKAQAEQTMEGNSPRSLLMQSLYDDEESVQIENCAQKYDYSCDTQSGCVSYQSDIESVLKDLRTEHVLLYHLIERQFDQNSCFHSHLIAGELSCTTECDGAAYRLNSDQSNICKDGFLQRMEMSSASDRKTCITSLLVHQYSRMCGADQELANEIAAAASSWYRSNNKLKGDFKCPSIVESGDL